MTRRSAILGYVVMVVLLSAGAAQSLSGSNTVFSDDIVDGTITTPDLKVGSISGSRLLDNGITGSKIYDNTITGADINEGSLQTVPSAATASNVLRAAVESGGTLVPAQSSTGVSAFASGASTGRTAVAFPRSVANCTYSATLADVGAQDPGPSYIPYEIPSGTIAVSTRSGRPTEVEITTRSSTGSLEFRPFMVIVVC